MNSTRIVVLGMHRSGTSTVIGLLQSAGCYLGEGDDFLPDNEANLKGYWERVDIVNLNKLLLKGCGLDWMSAYRFSPTDVPNATAAEFCKGAKQIISSLDRRGTWAIKDPRMCLTLPVWLGLLKDPIYVLCLRHPIEVAMSLKRRNNIPISVGCALWEAYTKAMLIYTAGAGRVLVSYARLMKHPAEESARLVKGLNEAGAHLLHTVELQPSLVDVRLHRQHLNTELLGAATPEQLALFKQLEDGSVPDPGALQLQSGTAMDLLQLFTDNQALSGRLKLEAGKFKEQISQLTMQRNEYKDRIKLFEARLPELKALIHSKQREVSPLMKKLRETKRLLRVVGRANDQNKKVGAAMSIIDDIIDSLAQDKKHSS